MSDINERLKQLQAEEARLRQMQAAPAASASAGSAPSVAGPMNGGGTASPWQPTGMAPPVMWNQPAAGSSPVGLLIPVEFETPLGTVSCYVQFAATGQDVQGQFMGLMEMLSGQGWKLRAFQRRQSWGGGGQGGGQGRGGWGMRRW